MTKVAKFAQNSARRSSVKYSSVIKNTRWERWYLKTVEYFAKFDKSTKSVKRALFLQKFIEGSFTNLKKNPCFHFNTAIMLPSRNWQLAVFRENISMFVMFQGQSIGELYISLFYQRGRLSISVLQVRNLNALCDGM